MYTVKIKTSKRVLTSEVSANSSAKALLAAQRVVYEELDNEEQKNFTISILKVR